MTTRRRTEIPVRSVVVDFDGTICPQDVSEEILQAFAPGDWWGIDLQFQRGEIGSRECLVRQAALLEGQESDLLAFVLERFAVDPTFPPFVAWAREQRLPSPATVWVSISNRCSKRPAFSTCRS